MSGMHSSNGHLLEGGNPFNGVMSMTGLTYDGATVAAATAAAAASARLQAEQQSQQQQLHHQQQQHMRGMALGSHGGSEDCISEYDGHAADMRQGMMPIG